jgi:hypothetical protein
MGKFVALGATFTLYAVERLATFGGLARSHGLVNVSHYVR